MTVQSRLLATLDALAGRRTVVIGDIAADEFLYGRVARVSREAPVLILEYDTTDIVPGGAGNAASNVAALGARTQLFGCVGRDDQGARLLASLPADFRRWSFLAQDQYLEVRTLLSGYLLSSQGDRMLMGHSVEGRFPFLDADVIELANALPAAYKLRILDEKHVLKRAARELVPDAILRRPKQPYRAPDALSFVSPGAPGWIRELVEPDAVAAAGVFDPRAVERLWKKCVSTGGGEQFSNADNMALVGVLSTGLLHAGLVRAAPDRAPPPPGFRTVVDRLAPPAAGTVALNPPQLGV